jgi:hypothetical protein
MPKTLTYDLNVEFVPLPEEREAEWMFAMGIISELLHKTREQALKEQEGLRVTKSHISVLGG